MRGIERHQNRIEIVAAQRFGHGGAVIVPGDADETDDFLVLQLLYGSQNSVRAANSVEVIEIAETMDLNQIEIVRLQKSQALLHRTQRAISVPRIDLGREKDVLAPLFGKFAEPFLAKRSSGRLVYEPAVSK